MNTHTISPPQWKSVFDSLSRVYDGAHASLEILGPELGAQFEIENEPLRGISYDARSGVELHFTTRDGRHLTHRIPRPTQVQIEERDDGLLNAVEIDSKGDPQRVLRFQSPLPSRLLTS